MTTDPPKPPETAAERTRAFLAERARQLRAGAHVTADTKAEVVRVLKQAQQEVAATLAAAPTDWQLYHLTHLKAEIARALAAAEAGLSAAVTEGLDRGWRAGVALVDAPLAAAGVALTAQLAATDTRRLEAMTAFCTDRIKNVAATVVNRINGELGLAMVGGKTPFQAAQAVAGILQKGGIDRAVTIVQTEVGAAFSAATQARQEQARAVLPGLRKQWRRSGKTHSRLTHDLADGQIRDVNEPFLVGGQPVMFPRDTAAPAKERIRCGCTSLPHMAHWGMSHPLDKPFSPSELDASPAKRRLEDAKATHYDTWAKSMVDKSKAGVAGGTNRRDGTVKTAGTLLPEVDAFLRAKGIQPLTQEVAVSDRMLHHFVRDSKNAAGKSIPFRVARRLPQTLAKPQAVLWDKRDPGTLHYITAVGGGEKRLARITVKVNHTVDRAKLNRHNFVISAGLVNKTTLADVKAYEMVTGAL